MKKKKGPRLGGSAGTLHGLTEPGGKQWESWGKQERTQIKKGHPLEKALRSGLVHRTREHRGGDSTCSRIEKEKEGGGRRIKGKSYGKKEPHNMRTKS